MANLDIYVHYLTRVVIRSDDTWIDGDRELVGKRVDCASIGLVEAVRGIIYILSNLHVNGVYANVSNRSGPKRHFVIVGESLGRKVDTACLQTHEGQVWHQLNEVVAAILLVDCLHVVFLIGQVLHLRRPNDRLSDHVNGLGCPDETRRWTVARIVDDCDEERLVFLATSAHPHAKSYWTTAKTFAWTKFVSIGSVLPLSTPEAFKDEPL